MKEAALEIRHARFGKLEVCAEEVISFPGLPGFPAARRFIVRQHDRGSAFGWFISCDVPDLAFAVADPRDYAPSYSPELAPRELRSIEYRDGDELQILVIATLRKGQIALNLAGPLVINARNRLGVQAILDGPDCCAQAQDVESNG